MHGCIVWTQIARPLRHCGQRGLEVLRHAAGRLQMLLPCRCDGWYMEGRQVGRVSGLSMCLNAEICVQDQGSAICEDSPADVSVSYWAEPFS
jgi:hypothetical protein